MRGLHFEMHIGLAGDVVSGHGETTATRGHHWRVAEQLDQGLKFQGRGHYQHAQFLAQIALALEAQSQSQIRVQAAFVKFVEDDATDARQFGRIILEHARQDAFGDHFDARCAADAGFESRTKSDRAADSFSHQLRHAGCHCTRCDPARLEHENFLVAEPGTVEQEQGHEGALAGTRRRFQHYVAAACDNASASAGKASVTGRIEVTMKCARCAKDNPRAVR